MIKFYSELKRQFYALDFREDYEATGTWPADAREITPEEEAALRTSPAFTTPSLTDAEKMDAAMSAVDAAINKVATDLRYFSATTFALRAGYPGPFHDQGLAFAQWMDASNAAAYVYLARIQAGEVPIPTPEEAVAMMPPVPSILLPK